MLDAPFLFEFSHQQVELDIEPFGDDHKMRWTARVVLPCGENLSHSLFLDRKNDIEFIKVYQNLILKMLKWKFDEIVSGYSAHQRINIISRYAESGGICILRDENESHISV